MRGRDKGHTSSGREMAARQETEAVQRDAMQQPAGRANERRRRWQTRRRRDKRASADVM